MERVEVRGRRLRWEGAVKAEAEAGFRRVTRAIACFMVEWWRMMTDN